MSINVTSKAVVEGLYVDMETSKALKANSSCRGEYYRAMKLVFGLNADSEVDRLVADLERQISDLQKPKVSNGARHRFESIFN